MRIYENHGDTGTRLHRIWKSMKCRCCDKNHPSYKWYGARGVTICEEWLNSYTAFKNWSIRNGYKDVLELDRVDVNGNYSPSNCRWVTHHEQTMNRRDTLYVISPTERTTFREFCQKHHINVRTATQWRQKGIMEEKIFDTLGFKVNVIGGKTKEVVQNEDIA